jgi:hypothetical protein
MRPAASLDARLYRAALYLYPPAFRREFSPDMIRDFDEARREAQLAGRGLWAFRAQMSADLGRSVVLQWLRTGLPAIVAMAVTGPLIVASALASVWRPVSFVLPQGTADADLIALELLVAVVILVIAATIIFTLWFTRPILRRRRP